MNSAVSFEGEVEEIVDGPWACLGGWVTSNLPGTTRFRVADGDESFWVGWTLPRDLIELGDAISVSYRADLGQHSTSGNLLVKRSDGALLGWLAKNGVDGFDLPAGIHVERGGETCRYETDCSTVELVGLQVEVFGEQQRVPYGASVEVGDYVVQGGDRRLTASRCQRVQSGGASIAIYARTRPPTDADAGEP